MGSRRSSSVSLRGKNPLTTNNKQGARREIPLELHREELPTSQRAPSPLMVGLKPTDRRPHAPVADSQSAPGVSLFYLHFI